MGPGGSKFLNHEPLLMGGSCSLCTPKIALARECLICQGLRLSIPDMVNYARCLLLQNKVLACQPLPDEWLPNRLNYPPLWPRAVNACPKAISHLVVNNAMECHDCKVCCNPRSFIRYLFPPNRRDILQNKKFLATENPFITTLPFIPKKDSIFWFNMMTVNLRTLLMGATFIFSATVNGVELQAQQVGDCKLPLACLTIIQMEDC